MHYGQVFYQNIKGLPEETLNGIASLSNSLLSAAISGGFSYTENPSKLGDKPKDRFLSETTLMFTEILSEPNSLLFRYRQMPDEPNTMVVLCMGDEGYQTWIKHLLDSTAQNENIELGVLTEATPFNEIFKDRTDFIKSLLGIETLDNLHVGLYTLPIPLSLQQFWESEIRRVDTRTDLKLVVNNDKPT